MLSRQFLPGSQRGKAATLPESKSCSQESYFRGRGAGFLNVSKMFSAILLLKNLLREAITNTDSTHRQYRNRRDVHKCHRWTRLSCAMQPCFGPEELFRAKKRDLWPENCGDGIDQVQTMQVSNSHIPTQREKQNERDRFQALNVA